MIKTSSDILLEAANLLEEEGRWSKGQYFNFNDKGCAMCAHGAIAYCGNPKVKEKVDKSEWLMDLEVAREGAAVVSNGSMIRRGAAQENISPEQYVSKRYGEVGVAHYRAAQAGLTFSYNDNPRITQQDVVGKLREAACL